MLVSPLLSCSKSCDHAVKYGAGFDKQFSFGRKNRPHYQPNGSFESNPNASSVPIGELQMYSLSSEDAQRLATDVKQKNTDGLLRLKARIAPEDELSFKGGIPYHFLLRQMPVLIPHLRHFDAAIHPLCGISSADFGNIGRVLRVVPDEVLLFATKALKERADVSCLQHRAVVNKWLKVVHCFCQRRDCSQQILQRVYTQAISRVLFESRTVATPENKDVSTTTFSGSEAGADTDDTA